MSFVHFLAFSHFKKRRAIFSFFFFFILLGLRKGFYKEGIEICLFPISLSNEFSGNVSSRSLCFNFIVHILVCTFYDCQIGFNKNFSVQRKLCRLGTKTFRKARDPANKKKSIFGSESLKSRLELVLPTAFKEMLTTPHGKDNLKLTQTKVRVLLFEAFICMAWR